jgi:hypothetical protein
VFHLLPGDSAVGGTKYCGRLGKSDVVVLHLKVASTIRGCEEYGVMILFSMDLSARSRTNLVKTSYLLRVDSATAACLLPDVVPFQLSTPSPARDVLPMCVCVCVCPYVCAVHSRLVQVLPEVRLVFTL